MKLKQKKLPTFLLITQDRTHIRFFEKLKSKIENYSLICSKSKEEALDDLKRHEITLIIIDNKTPDLNVPSCCKAFRACVEYEHTPILILTGQLKKQFIQSLMKVGATDFLLEPLDESEFLMRIEIAEETKKTHQKISKLVPFLKKKKTTTYSLKDHNIFNNKAAQIIDKAKKEGNPLALLLIEIDQYKAYATKTRITLQSVIESFLHSITRKQDLLFPQKQGKFITLLPKTSMRAAEFIAENMQEAFNNETFFIEKRKVPLTLSIGLAEIEEIIGENDKKETFYLDRLMQLARERLTRAKEKGNTIISH